jgi:hypothetical protein
MSDFYTQWIGEQAHAIMPGMRDFAGRGITNVAVYVIPSNGPVAGKLVLATELPDGATDVVRFPSQGSRVMSVPYSHLQSLLWHACRRFPILPVE